MEESRIEYVTFFRSYYEIAKHLSPQNQGIFWSNLMAYVFDGDAQPEGDELQVALFLSVKPHLDASLRKMEAGRKGGKASQQAEVKQDASKPEAEVKQEASNKRTKNLEQKNKEQKNSEPPLPPPSPQGGEGDEAQKQAFDAFWSLYPKKRDREQAWVRWQRIAPSEAEAAAIRAAVERNRAGPDWTKEGGRFIPAPAKWLEDRRWEESPLTTPQGIRIPDHARENARWMRRMLEEDG